MFKEKTGLSAISLFLCEIKQIPLLGKEGEIAAFVELEKAKNVLFKKALFLKPVREQMLFDLKNFVLGKSHNSRPKTDEDKDNIRTDLNAAKSLFKKISGTRKSLWWNIIQNSGVYFSLCKLERWISGLKDQNLFSDELAMVTEIRNRIMKANLRLVVDIAKSYPANSSIDFLDKINEGNIGLMKAVSMFNLSLGYKFSTYAVWWIKQSIIRALVEKGHVIRIPVNKAQEKSKISRVFLALAQSYGREPTMVELAKKLKRSQKQIAEVLAIVKDPFSLNDPIEDGEGAAEFINIIKDKITPPLEDSTEEKERMELVNLALRELPPREEIILRMRFGVGCNYDHTLEEVGKSFHMSRERVRQIEKTAKRKLRYRLLRRGIRPKALFM
ncbi:hypothetical protein A3B05_00260 [Candidatus Giovannonibacteria bacterium RIFCSPLOWO2_01_FULL_43_160]|uniref:RNA polymerase sigma factor n=2 Tax=Candidatus Giovannoniibacteriota TaxID=1752738 RepID=A0A0G1LVU6_9BACT|nr:MAG: RNA polymerase sigma factor [Candidatus Giovannonibacteria bacterium GW2011_GWB1_43_13]KKS99774.1 MAG: RNA polymerase sigma factor [Candidatus Giovannonibacteria bacterium GW2011_GWA1_43_15]KKT63859.1 MAG: RNA polymerase sigma factor [Candidatus Giovannonibacteria bacterium GW2011_GWA2_44_26]OGF58181.1 MAG: hypothetical protein A2652_02625 [Candidatus Giovannonibacteria bacterium RIFCSPHIGHO2_01_FULL_43_140]OGF70460.1 MAG: hypothetical protein A3C76_00060 [Candidatus Giovannonibacteria 